MPTHPSSGQPTCRWLEVLRKFNFHSSLAWASLYGVFKKFSINFLNNKDLEVSSDAHSPHSVTEKGNTNFCKLNWENKFSPPGVGQVWTVRSSQGIKTFVETLSDSWSALHYFYFLKNIQKVFNKLQLRHKFFLNVPYQDPGQDTFMKNVNCYRW